MSIKYNDIIAEIDTGLTPPVFEIEVENTHELLHHTLNNTKYHVKYLS